MFINHVNLNSESRLMASRHKKLHKLAGLSVVTLKLNGTEAYTTTFGEHGQV